MLHDRHSVTLYLMRTVFLSDISVACSSKSVSESDEATGTFSTPLPVESPGAPSSFEVAVGAELSETDTEAEPEAAHMLTLEVRCRPLVRDRFWTMVLRRLSSPSISFLTNKQTEPKFE